MIHSSNKHSWFYRKIGRGSYYISFLALLLILTGVLNWGPPWLTGVCTNPQFKLQQRCHWHSLKSYPTFFCGSLDTCNPPFSSPSGKQERLARDLSSTTELIHFISLPSPSCRFIKHFPLVFCAWLCPCAGVTEPSLLLLDPGSFVSRDPGWLHHTTAHSDSNLHWSAPTASPAATNSNWL